MPSLISPDALLAKLILSLQLPGVLENWRKKFARQLEQTPEKQVVLL